MLIIKDRNAMLRRMEMIMDQEMIDVAEYRKNHNIPEDWSIEIVHTYPEDKILYDLQINPSGISVTSKVRAGNCAGISDEELTSAITEMINHEDVAPTFYDHFCTICREKNLDEIDVYKEAGLDRRLFSKIRKAYDPVSRKKVYNTSKDTVLALAVALGLNPREASVLLNSAGFSFEESELRDRIIKRMMTESWGSVSIDTVDDCLFSHGLRTLTGEP